MADDKRQSDDRAGQGPFSESDLARRFDRLSRVLDEEKRERLRAAETRPAGRSSYALALRLASEFVAGVLVGAAVGWALDRVAGTSPWGLIVFLLLGFAAGTLNVVRAAGGLSPPGPGRKDGGEPD
jgi:ATP synthase protein I